MGSNTPNPPIPRRGLYGVPHAWWVVICLLYIISPFDFFPEIIFGPIGLVDDAGILAFGASNLVHWLNNRRARTPRATP